MKRFYTTDNRGYREWSVIAFGWVVQVTYWRGPPRSVYAGVELHWWRASQEKEA